MVSVPLRNIQASAGDIVIQYGRRDVNIKDAVSSNEVSVRNLIIAVPAMVLALVSRVGGVVDLRVGAGESLFLIICVVSTFIFSR